MDPPIPPTEGEKIKREAISTENLENKGEKEKRSQGDVTLAAPSSSYENVFQESEYIKDTCDKSYA